MLVGCLWQNDHIVTVSLGGTISIFSASDLDKSPFQFSGHMKNISSLSVLRGSSDYILSGSYDGLICKWMMGRGFCGKLQRKQNSQIKCFAAHEEEIITSGFDNTVSWFSNCLYGLLRSFTLYSLRYFTDKLSSLSHSFTI